MIANLVSLNYLQKVILATVGTLFAIGLQPSDAAMGAPLPIAKFTELKSTTTEQNGRIELKVNFTHEFSGNLTYCVDGTAKRGTDYGSTKICSSHKVTTVTGEPTRKTTITLDLLDDSQVESVETIRVTLQPGDGFALGSRHQHTVRVRDNDTNWRVVHDVDGMSFDYGMQIIRKGETTTATVRSDGLSSVPAGTYPVKLTADVYRFEAIVGPITVAAEDTLLGEEISRIFTLVAKRPQDGKPIDYDRPLIGAATETWVPSKGATYLSRRNPISGSFLMSRIVGDAIPIDAGEEKNGSAKKNLASKVLHRGSECEIAGLLGANSFAVKPVTIQVHPKLSSGEILDASTRSQLSVSPGTPFAPHIPYPDFVNETLARAKANLYYENAPTQETKDTAAFRYKTLLFKKEQVETETYIRAFFDKLEDHWDCTEKIKAHQTAQSVIGALRFVPGDRALRWALLDIYYDIAVAEKALAREKQVAVAKSILKNPAPGESLIHQEIALLEQALTLYRNAFASYMNLLQHTFGVDLEDFETNPEFLGKPFGYHIFRKEVPLRSPLATPFADKLSTVDEPKLEGYKDITLLFSLLREYLRTAAQLSKRYIMRNGPSDLESAEHLIRSALLATWFEGNALLAMFPEISTKGAKIDSTAGLREAVAGWRNSYSSLGHVYDFLKGNTNILGYSKDFLLLTQSTIPGDPKSQYFHTFDFFKQYMQSADGPLMRAKMDLEKARRDYANFQDRSDHFAHQLAATVEQYDSRLREIVGVRPGESGYDDPAKNKGGLIRQRLLNIDAATLRIKRNRQRIENLEETIRIELWRRGQERRINDAISSVYIDFGEKQEKLTDEIAKIREAQSIANNEANILGSLLTAAAGIPLVPATAGASLTLTAGGIANFISSVIHATRQAGKELAIGNKQALKERYAAKERVEIHSLHDELLDATSRAKIKIMLLDMSLLALDSQEATIGLKLEMEQLAALYLEKEDLERRKKENNKLLAERYFADPSHRILKNASLLRSEYSFADAQRWMFFTIRAAEYKWNQSFLHETDAGVFSMKTVFKARNAKELDDLFSKLTSWDGSISLPGHNDTGYMKFSFREDLLGYKHKGIYIDKDGTPIKSLTAFQNFINSDDNYLLPKDRDNPRKGYKVLKLRFNTAYERISGDWFLRNRWLEKIKYLRVEMQGAVPKGINSIISGVLSYGGVSLIRNQSPGSRNPRDSTRLVNESTAYSTRHWYYEKGQWHSNDTFQSHINIQVSNDPKVPREVYKINTFKELSVATSEWILYVPVEKDGHKLIDLSGLTDIYFHVYYYWYARNLR